MTSVWHCKNFWKTEPLRQAKPCHWQQRWFVLYNIIISNLIRTWPDNTRSCVNVCALMAPRLRINGYPRIQKVMELLIVNQSKQYIRLWRSFHSFAYYLTVTDLSRNRLPCVTKRQKWEGSIPDFFIYFAEIPKLPDNFDFSKYSEKKAQKTFLVCYWELMPTAYFSRLP